MLRVLPPPKALLVFDEAPLRAHLEQRITPDALDIECLSDASEALRRFAAEFRPVVLTDNLELFWVGSWREYTTKFGQDQDATPVPVAQLDNRLDHRAWSQERCNSALR